MYRIFPKIGRSNHGRSNFPTITMQCLSIHSDLVHRARTCHSISRRRGVLPRESYSTQEFSFPSTFSCSCASTHAGPSACEQRSTEDHVFRRVLVDVRDTQPGEDLWHAQRVSDVPNLPHFQTNRRPGYT